MKANRGALQRSPLRHDEGVSTVLGAVLVFGLFVITLVTVRTQFVPVWQEQREGNLMQEVSSQMAELKTSFDRQVGNQTLVPIAQPFTLRTTEGFAMFQETDLPGTLTFRPAAAGAGLAVSSTQVTLQQQNGVELFGLNEQWTGMTGGTVSGISQVVHLRMRIFDPADSSDGSSISLTVTDADGNCAGRVTTSLTVQSADRNIHTEIRGPNTPIGLTCTSTPINMYDTDSKKQIDPEYWYLDLLAADLHFTSVLGAAKYPISLSISDAGLTGDYAIVYDTVVGGGTTRVGGTGVVIPNYSSTTPVGTVTLVKANNRFPGQTFSLEYGAVILSQADGTAMLVPPQFTVSTSPTQTNVAWSIPGLSGSPNAITGSGAATLSSTPGGRSFVAGVAPRMTFTINTGYPALWASHWDAALVAAGLTGNVAVLGAPCATSVQYAICTTATTATLTVYGPTVDPVSTTNDLFFNLQTANLQVQLKATG